MTLVDSGDWRAGIAAAVLTAPPLRAPILLTDGEDMPEATSTALDSLRPTGARALRGAQAMEVGEARAPGLAAGPARRAARTRSSSPRRSTRSRPTSADARRRTS